MEDYKQKFTELQKKSEDNKIKKAKLEERKDSLLADKEKILIQLQEFGVEPENLQNEIDKLESQIKEKIEEAEKLLS